MPITWRNIEAPSLTGVAGMAEITRRSFNDAMTALRGSFDEYGEQIQTQWDQGKDANTQAFLDKLAQYKTPEELAAAQAAGEIQEFRQQFGNKIDAATVRDAEANLQQKLIERITAQNQYGDYTINRNARPLVDQFNALRAAGKLDEAQKFLEDNVLGVDESAFAQSLLDRRDKAFDQRISQGELAVSQGKLSLDVAANRRAQTTWNQGQSEYLGKQAAGALVQDLIGSGKDLATLRAEVTKQAEQGNWSSTITDYALKDLEGKYAATLDLTPEQQKTVDAALAPDVGRHKLSSAIAKNVYESTLQQLPLNQEYAFTEKDYVPEGDTIGKIAKDSGDEAWWDDNDDRNFIKGDELANKYVTQIMDEVEKDYGVSAVDAKGQPLTDSFGNPVKSFTTDKVRGLLLKRAYSKIAGTPDWIGGDKSINGGLLKQAYEEEVKNYRMHEANRFKRLELERAYAEEQAKRDAVLVARQAEEVKKYRTANFKARLRNN